MEEEVYNYGTLLYRREGIEFVTYMVISRIGNTNYFTLANNETGKQIRVDEKDLVTYFSFSRIVVLTEIKEILERALYKTDNLLFGFRADYLTNFKKHKTYDE